jgi:hypothetical protein
MEGLSFYIHYNRIIPEENTTLLDLFVIYFSGALSFKTQDTDSEVFNQTLRYLKLDNRKNEDENFCTSISKGIPGMDIGYLRDIMRNPNNGTLISYINTEGVIKPMAVLVFKNGNYTDEAPPILYLDGMCSDQQSPIRGIGSQLLTTFINAAREVGFQFIELASASKKATETWKKKGFERQPGRRDHDNLPIFSLQLGGEEEGEGEEKRVLIDLKHNNDILVCDEKCKNLGPLPKVLDSLNGINNYINEKFDTKSNFKINKGGKKTKKYKTKKYKTKKHKLKKNKTKKIKTKKHKLKKHKTK